MRRDSLNSEEDKSALWTMYCATLRQLFFQFPWQMLSSSKTSAHFLRPEGGQSIDKLVQSDMKKMMLIPLFKLHIIIRIMRKMILIPLFKLHLIIRIIIHALLFFCFLLPPYTSPKVLLQMEVVSWLLCLFCQLLTIRFSFFSFFCLLGTNQKVKSMLVSLSVLLMKWQSCAVASMTPASRCVLPSADLGVMSSAFHPAVVCLFACLSAVLVLVCLWWCLPVCLSTFATHPALFLGLVTLRLCFCLWIWH